MVGQSLNKVGSLSVLRLRSRLCEIAAYHNYVRLGDTLFLILSDIRDEAMQDNFVFGGLICGAVYIREVQDDGVHGASLAGERVGRLWAWVAVDGHCCMPM